MSRKCYNCDCVVPKNTGSCVGTLLFCDACAKQHGTALVVWNAYKKHKKKALKIGILTGLFKAIVCMTIVLCILLGIFFLSEGMFFQGMASFFAVLCIVCVISELKGG